LLQGYAIQVEKYRSHLPEGHNNLMHKEIEVYVDDMMAKSKKEESFV
jgi:hypothetical protein